MLERNLSSVLMDRPANVEKDHVCGTLAGDLPGARSTSRFDVHAIYEKKIDVAAERERLTKELEKIEKEQANGQRQLSNEQFSGQSTGESRRGTESTRRRVAGVAGEDGGEIERVGIGMRHRRALFEPHGRARAPVPTRTERIWTGIHDGIYGDS